MGEGQLSSWKDGIRLSWPISKSYYQLRHSCVRSAFMVHFLCCLISWFWLGHWSKEEEDKLTAIVTDMTVNQGKDIDNDVFWGKVSEFMGGKRGRQYCRIKWYSYISLALVESHWRNWQERRLEQNSQKWRPKAKMEFARWGHPRSQVSLDSPAFKEFDWPLPAGLTHLT